MKFGELFNLQKSKGVSQRPIDLSWESKKTTLPKSVVFRAYKSLGLASQPFFEVVNNA